MSVIFAILLFSILVFVHEFGHFAAAKLSGVQVNEFSIFMGPALVKWERDETKYSIRCIPFGGYCAMEGENEDTDNPRSFQKAKWWKRLRNSWHPFEFCASVVCWNTFLRSCSRRHLPDKSIRKLLLRNLPQ